MSIINSSNIEIALAKNIGEYSSLTSVGDAVFRTIGNRKLFIQNGSETNIPAICIDTSNNIGIGTTMPLQKIDIRGIITSNSYTFTNNFYSSISTVNTNNVIISTANIERFRIDAIGNVYNPEDILSNKTNPKIISKYVKVGDTITMPEYFDL